MTRVIQFTAVKLPRQSAESHDSLGSRIDAVEHSPRSAFLATPLLDGTGISGWPLAGGAGLPNQILDPNEHDTATR